jgi:hypothetical protein
MVPERMLPRGCLKTAVCQLQSHSPPALSMHAALCLGSTLTFRIDASHLQVHKDFKGCRIVSVGKHPSNALLLLVSQGGDICMGMGIMHCDIKMLHVL